MSLKRTARRALEENGHLSRATTCRSMSGTSEQRQSRAKPRRQTIILFRIGFDHQTLQTTLVYKTAIVDIEHEGNNAKIGNFYWS